MTYFSHKMLKTNYKFYVFAVRNDIFFNLAVSKKVCHI